MTKFETSDKCKIPDYDVNKAYPYTIDKIKSSKIKLKDLLLLCWDEEDFSRTIIKAYMIQETKLIIVEPPLSMEDLEEACILMGERDNV